jgi:Flp pilus assembly pilin Flp
MTGNIRELVQNQTGQGTVEYMLAGLVLVSAITTLGTLANRLEEGLFVEHAARSASHTLGENTAGTAGDVLLY